MRAAVKVGGSVAVGEAGPNADYLLRLRDVIKGLDLQRLALGVGGGKQARNYLQCVQPYVGPAEAEALLLELLKANTRFVALLLGGRPILDERTMHSVSRRTRSRLLIVGGIRPKRSTDANTAILAEAIGADLFVKMTDVDGIYTADPDLHSDAELIPRMGYDAALRMSIEGRPGSYGILDRTALQVLKRAGIPTRVVAGRDPENLARALRGEALGTLIE